MARLRRDNGDYEDTTTKKILSPYPDDRSAVTDCRKLASTGFGDRRAVLIYGFEDPSRPIMWLIEAFELIAARTVTLGPRETAPLNDLVHPVFAAGHVWGWEVLDSRSDSNGVTQSAHRTHHHYRPRRGRGLQPRAVLELIRKRSLVQVQAGPPSKRPGQRTIGHPEPDTNHPFPAFRARQSRRPVTRAAGPLLPGPNSSAHHETADRRSPARPPGG